MVCPSTKKENKTENCSGHPPMTTLTSSLGHWLLCLLPEVLVRVLYWSSSRAITSDAPHKQELTVMGDAYWGGQCCVMARKNSWLVHVSCDVARSGGYLPGSPSIGVSNSWLGREVLVVMWHGLGGCLPGSPSIMVTDSWFGGEG